MSFLTKLYQNKFIGRIFHTTLYCLQRELMGCESVLDLGCGPSSPLKYCAGITSSVGVDAFLPYIEKSKAQKIHSEYIYKKLSEVDFPAGSFDAVLLVEVLEHLPKDLGYEMLKKAEKWASKKIIISTPNGYFPMEKVDENEFQKHLSGWRILDFKKLGFKVFGMSGAKFFYTKNNRVHSLFDDQSIFSNIRFHPKKFFYFISAFSQIILYYTPKYSFGIMAIKSK